MVCTDLRKVWTDVKGHRRQVLKCMDKKAPRKRRKHKKKITQPLNFVRLTCEAPGLKEKQEKEKEEKT